MPSADQAGSGTGITSNRLFAGLFAGDAQDTTDRRHIAIVAAARDHDVIVGDGDGVGRIELHPAALATAPGAHPGVHRVGALEPGFARAVGWCAESR